MISVDEFVAFAIVWEQEIVLIGELSGGNVLGHGFKPLGNLFPSYQGRECRTIPAEMYQWFLKPWERGGSLFGSPEPDDIPNWRNQKMEVSHGKLDILIFAMKKGAGVIFLMRPERLSSGRPLDSLLRGDHDTRPTGFIPWFFL